MFADFKCRFIIIIIIIIITHFPASEIHNSGPVEGIYNEIIARDRICQLSPLKSEDFTVEFVHFAESF